MDHGPVIQMQRDLQWYKFVEKSVSPSCRYLTNNNGLTPWMLFRNEHIELRSRAQEWIMETASSFVRAAGVIAIADAVAFPNIIAYAGGNKLGETDFQIFAISYTMSFLTSQISMIMYIDIAISKFTEEEFLYSLPNKVILGILSIFVAVLYLMAAFFAGMYIVFAHKIAVLLILVFALALFKIAPFVVVQFPVLVDFIYNTYFSGKGGRQH